MKKFFLRTVIFYLFTNVVFGSGGPQNVLVVVNDNDLESLEIGRYYADARSLSDRQIFHVQIPVATDLEYNSFNNDVKQPIKEYILNEDLQHQINFVVFCWKYPYRISRSGSTENSITSTMYYDFFNQLSPFSYDCSISTGSENIFFKSETAFRHDLSLFTEDRYLSTLLTAGDLNATKTFIDRSVSADFTMPTNKVFLLHTTDIFRNLQWGQFNNASYLSRFLSTPQNWQLLDANTLKNKTDITGYLNGRTTLLPDLYSNEFLPGAFGHHLTSYGGIISGTGQMSILEWIKAGCSGTFGAVAEPCSYTVKFPDTRLHFWYGRGFNLGESIYMSVRNPYEGLCVADPICAPFSVPGNLQVQGLSTNQIVSGMLPLTNTVSHSDSHIRFNGMEMFLDGQYHSTLEDLSLLASNQLQATVNGNVRVYTVKSEDTLKQAVEGLAQAINQAPDLGVTAVAYPDRLALYQDALGVSATGLTYSIEILQGSASEIRLSGWASSTNFLESDVQALEGITLEGAPSTGDMVRAIITTLTGTIVTTAVTKAGNETRVQLMDQLMAQINAHPQLTGPDGCEAVYRSHYSDENPTTVYLRSRTNTWEGANLFVDFQVISTTMTNTSFADNFNDIAEDIVGRGMLFFSAGDTTMITQTTLDTSTLPDGEHVLMMVAREGTAMEVQTRKTIPFVVDNNLLTCELINPVEDTEILQHNSFTCNASASPGSITSLILYVEGKKYAQTNTGLLTASIDTSAYGVGALVLQALAYNSFGDAVFSEPIEVQILANYDGDQLEDAWELQFYNDITLYDENDDPDNDGASNGHEQFSDTDPTDASSLLVLDIESSSTQDVYAIRFPSRSTRHYQMEVNDLSLLNSTGWSNATPVAFPGNDGIYLWIDDGTTPAGPITNDHRFYRVNVQHP